MKKLLILLLLPFLVLANDSVFEDEGNNQASSNNNFNQYIDPMINLENLQDSFIYKDKTKSSIKENGNSDNILNIKYKENKTYRIRTRNAMETLLILHNDKVAFALVGDPKGFQIKNLGLGKYDLSNMVKIKPLMIGVDTSLTIIGESGNIYSFYLFSTDHKNEDNPHLVVFVSEELEHIQKLQITNLEKEDFEKARKAKKAQEQKLKENIENNPNFITVGEGIEKISIDKRYITRDFTQTGAEELKAYDIFRDNKWTYFKYDKDDANKKFPVIFRVVDGYDNPVNTRVVGDYIMAETIADKFTLRIGDKYVCVRKKGKSDEK
ncbi:TrbG/VirB9 family P-type conjugative transfer protein [Sulfurospirillum arcachonense]|uniref:TrbG/VirB9 family P-type conjugative transfer protein n=1 Tax=Sulfurospirillum arcachonense TaxID=57666 RepID=UPI0004697B99|nr:TrbG/VirB9 family P-type conjugative transfer protein [Sulfurospirillum arcachonense]